jgi:hypothetical protein
MLDISERRNEKNGDGKNSFPEKEWWMQNDRS